MPGDSNRDNHTQALLESLRTSPLLVSSLTEAVCFDRSKFSSIDGIPALNFSQKLGHLYEDALEHLLASSSEVDLLGKGIQIFNENRITLGELDYLLRDRKTGENIHLELAVKFYLVKYEKGEANYPGPDPRDNWLNKLQRLHEHQLRLTKSQPAQKLLLEDYGITEVTSQQLVYGKLFDHYLAETRPCPPAMNASCQRGEWRYLHEWERDSELQEVTIIPKHLWPVEMRSLLPGLSVVSREDFIMEASKRCVMIWDEASSSNQFVAPNTWG